MRIIFGLLSGVLPIIGMLPYIRDELRGKTKPHRMAEFIYAVLDSIAFASQLAKGATWSAILPGVGMVEMAIGFLLSLKYGMGGTSKKDIGALILAGFGLVLWYFTKQPLTALFIVIGVDLIGTTLVVIKTYAHPHTETLSSWFLSFLAGLFAAAAVGRWSFTFQIYPLYIALGNAVICATILLRRNKVPPNDKNADLHAVMV
ncbi:MAG TPA: hypothetical protein VH234_03895 [Candidatus Saccharimonadales bacterium]|jgi:hypothetical protein|nr:hypothetical protein [Candidatus Saccharimonadales bacterium]